MSDLENIVQFKLLIDNSFTSINTDHEITPTENKNVLSVINDFVDGAWRYSKFQRFIWDNIAETALSAKERDSLVGQAQTLLAEAAKNLRLTDKEGDISKGSELSEILLYGIMKHHYKALPIVPKIFYKQNPQDNAKGADSVHIVLEGEDDFSIWFGEAKFYNSIENARIASIVESIGNSLQSDKLEKENSIITNVSDIDSLIESSELRGRIRRALMQSSSLDDLKPKLHVPIMLLHECELTKNETTLNDDYKRNLIAYHEERSQAFFKKQIEKLGTTVFKYSEITFHVILFPVPSKDTVVEKFLSNVEHYKNQ